jgi:integrase
LIRISLRTFCSWLAIAGVSIKEIQEAAGHKTMTMSAAIYLQNTAVGGGANRIRLEVAAISPKNIPGS